MNEWRWSKQFCRKAQRRQRNRVYLRAAAAAAAKSLQSCPTLCDPIDGSPPGSAILGIVLGASKSTTRVHEASSRTFKQIHTKYILTLWNFCCL